MTEHPVFDVVRRTGPLLVSIPHLGRTIPHELRDAYSDEALSFADTDWHLDRFYAFAEHLGATVLQAKVSRHVIDLNRPATGESLYPGMVTTTLCPTETFRGEPLYPEGAEPKVAEVERRVGAYWRPYHEQLKAEVARLRALHCNVLLWDAHSIASILPRMFSGKLPDFCFGTSDGQSCHPGLIDAALDPMRSARRSWVLNGRFKGGFITRRYGAPREGVHAIQLEMCQSVYMDEAPPFGWREDLASQSMPAVRTSMEAAVERLGRLPACETCEVPGH